YTFMSRPPAKIGASQQKENCRCRVGLPCRPLNEFAPGEAEEDIGPSARCTTREPRAYADNDERATDGEQHHITGAQVTIIERRPKRCEVSLPVGEGDELINNI